MKRSEYGREATHEEIGKWFERSVAERYSSIRKKNRDQS